MQITENAIINWLWGALVLVAGLLGRIIWKIWSSYSRRLKAVEEQMAHAITKPEVDEIVADVKAEFKQEHRDIIAIIDKRHSELRDDLREMRDLIVRPWNGRERRGKDE